MEEYTAAPGNAAAAARKAGYSSKRAKVTACELLKVPAVQAAIDGVRAERRASLGYSSEKAALDLMRAINAPSSNVAQRIAAIRELGRLLGLYRQ